MNIEKEGQPSWLILEIDQTFIVEFEEEQFMWEEGMALKL